LTRVSLAFSSLKQNHAHQGQLVFGNHNFHEVLVHIEEEGEDGHKLSKCGQLLKVLIIIWLRVVRLLFGGQRKSPFFVSRTIIEEEEEEARTGNFGSKFASDAHYSRANYMGGREQGENVLREREERKRERERREREREREIVSGRER
jgi:hypothetical protein